MPVDKLSSFWSMVFGNAKKLGLGRVLLVATLTLALMGTVSASNTVWHPMNETSSPAKDYYNSNDGVWQGSISGGINGKFGDGYDMSGGYVDDVYTPSVGTHSVNIWFKRNADLSSMESLFVVPGDQNIQLSRFESDDKVHAYTADSSSFYSVVSNSTLTDGNWHMATVRVDYGSKIQLFIDGQFHDSTSFSGTGGDVTGALAYGDNPSGSGGDFGGEMDEFRWFEGEYLSKQEIQNLYNCNQKTACNNPPQFDSVSTEPDSWTLNSDINVSANVSDGEGTVSSVSADVWENGSQIVSDASLSENSGTWSVDNLFTVDEADVYYNLTLTATDDDGATNTYETSQLIKNLDPKINHLAPTNNSDQFTYTPEYKIRIRDDGDNVPGENISCSLYSNGNEFRNVWALENQSQTKRTFSGELSEDVGSNKFKTSCVDGTRTNTTTNYQTRYSRVENVYAASPVYETENRTFEVDLKTGDMVNNADFQLSYDGGVEASKSLSSSGVETLRPNLHHEIPLVDSNQTTLPWRIEYDLNISDFQNQTTSTVENQTGNQDQEVLWSYWINSTQTVPENGKYIEKEDIVQEVVLGTKTKKAEIDGTTKYHRDDSTEEMVKDLVRNDSTTLQGTIDSGLAENFNKSTFDVSSTIDLSFNGESRQLQTADQQIELYRIVLTDGTTDLDTEKTLEFDVNYEEEGGDVPVELTADFSVWKTKEVIRRYQFQEPEADTHSYYIYPKWAEYEMQTKPYPDQTKFDLIQYFNPDDNKVRRSYFFPIPQTINNQTTEAPLKTINQSEASRIDFEVTRSGGQPAENVFCRVDRKFGGGDFETVFMIKTGSQGLSQSFAEVNEIYYSFTCYKNGKVLEKFPSQIMKDPMRLTIGETETETILDYDSKFDASCSYNETSISCDYQSTTEQLQEAVLEVNRLEAVQNQEVCSKTSPTITGVLTCNDLNTTAEAYSYTVNGEYAATTAYGTAGQTGDRQGKYGAAGIVLTMILFLLPYAATAFDVRLGIGIGTISLLFSNLQGFWVLTPSQRATLIAVAIIAGLVGKP